MNTIDPDSMTILDDGSRAAATIARDPHHHGWRRREGRSCVNPKSYSLLHTTAFLRLGTASVSPKLRDAILGLHRDDALRRAYVRRWWMETSELRKPARRKLSTPGEQ